MRCPDFSAVNNPRSAFKWAGWASYGSLCPTGFVVECTVVCVLRVCGRKVIHIQRNSKLYVLCTINCYYTLRTTAKIDTYNAFNGV